MGTAKRWRRVSQFTTILRSVGLTSQTVTNRDGYFDADDLLQQVDNAINIFESKTNGFATALFLFDNAPSHQRRAPDARSARKMPKGSHPT
jgi:hypothetical protein